MLALTTDNCGQLTQLPLFRSAKHPIMHFEDQTQSQQVACKHPQLLHTLRLFVGSYYFLLRVRAVHFVKLEVRLINDHVIKAKCRKR